MQIIPDLVLTTNISSILELYFFSPQINFHFLVLGVIPLTLHHWNQKLLRKNREKFLF